MATADMSRAGRRPMRRAPAHQRVLNSVPVAVAIYAAVVGLIVYGSYAGARNMGYNWQWYRLCCVCQGEAATPGGDGLVGGWGDCVAGLGW